LGAPIVVSHVFHNETLIGFIRLGVLRTGDPKEISAFRTYMQEKVAFFPMPNGRGADDFDFRVNR
jgi:hypothetical protein